MKVVEIIKAIYRSKNVMIGIIRELFTTNLPKSEVPER
jgi:hypothetical protein